MRDPANGIYGSGGGDAITIDMVVLTPGLYDRLIELGLDSIEARPA